MEAVCRGAKESPKTFEGRPSRYFLRGEPKMRTHLLTLLWPPELVFHVTRWSLMQTQPSHLVVEPGRYLKWLTPGSSIDCLSACAAKAGAERSLPTNRLMSGRASRISQMTRASARIPQLRLAILNTRLETYLDVATDTQWR